MKSLLKCLVIALIVGLVFYGLDAFAAQGSSGSNDVWKKAFNTLVRVFKNVRVLVYVIGAFGLIGIAIGGIVGKINFKWLGYLAAGLAIVAVADAIISYVVKPDQGGSTEAEISIDEFGS